MNKQSRKKLATLMLALALLLSLAPVAMAETNMAVNYCAVRVAPGDDSTIIGFLSYGDHVTVNFAQGIWSDVTFANGTGYVRSSNLIPVIENAPVPVIPQPKPVPVIPQPTTVPVIPQPTTVPVIQQPVPVIPQNTPVPVVQQPVPVIQQPVPVIQPAGSSTNYYTTTKLNVRQGPSSKYAKIGVLQMGAPVCVIGTSGDWYKINYNGLVGYVASKYVTQGSTYVTGYAQALNEYLVTNQPCTVYKGTGASYGELGAFPANYNVHVVGVCGNWYKVVFGGQYGYVQRAYLCDHDTYTVIFTTY